MKTALKHFERKAVTEYPNRFGLEEDELWLLTPYTFQVMKAIQHHAFPPRHYFTANSSYVFDPNNQHLIIQRNERKKLTAHNSPPQYTSDNQSLEISSTTEETFADWSGWAKRPAEGLLHSTSLGPHPMKVCHQLTSVPESAESPPPRIQLSHQPA